ncbi:phosphate ABC transporter permease subunit PstC [Glycocaulis profundi]|nr:phosphate ABC transporter permease subunit PstC [Glycocaulis profundi]
MQLSLFTALALLVLTAAGFLLGRRRALAAGQGRAAGLHSLPDYYGYYVAMWTGAPALVLLALYGLFGGMLVNTLALAELERSAEPLGARYESVLEIDPAHAGLRAERDQAEAGRLAAREYADAMFTQHGAESPQMAEAMTDVDGWIAEGERVEAELETRESQLLSQILGAAPDSPQGLAARAGLEYAQLPIERRQLFISDIRALAFGEGMASRDTAELRAAAAVFQPYETTIKWTVCLLAFSIAVIGLARAWRRVAPGFRARNRVEGAISFLLMLSSAIAILTTLGIVMSLLFEAIRFFAAIDWRVHEFLFGTQWSPQIAIRADQIGQSGAFGAVPLFVGTGLITLIAMAVAVPVGLFAAIYLSEYASPGVRAWAKPVLEILAGIPTVVYGFFALLTVGPFLRDFAMLLGYEDAVTQSALSAGLVMGVMIIPFVSSLSDDVINAVPQTLRDGAYAMGATKSEAVRQVVLPAALPGIVGAVLLAVSRAVGETMIVVMAAGQAANLTANPLESVTTITVQIVTLLTGDQEFNSAKTLSAFALGLVLFVMTLMLNIVALRVVQKYREKYD